ncbi:FecCD family ABC transporter permease [Desulfobaculum bizertense]|uniref:Iron complex transport system permease protein n=1 Tax=Desulfobaculum bizertense DSM 18034 TaxID=1121442 RepID=A0A1T4W2L4_9BACT|nr:iron ABC transporter permease [Desulfobaculum bizertense]UIJ38856.1 iron ABC transporter permease [Desulfobaculum bizertense]SKA71389.1 iron complex transport system permease protein [Desulfobaculum bizertense DSM 18034]
MTATEHILAKERAIQRRRTGAFLVLLVLSLCSLVGGCLFGPLDIPVSEVLRIFAHGLGFSVAGPEIEPSHSLVVLDIRLSRVCLAWMVGASLAAAGVVFQGILQNLLADPFTIGVSTGAAFGASLAIYAGLAGVGAFWGMGLLPLAAMLGALVALAAVIYLGRVGGQLRKETVVLAGIVVATFLSALIALLKSLDEESMSSIVFWVMGSFQGRSWSHVQFALPYIIVGAVFMVAYAREMDVLSMGDIQARMLGVDTERTRLILLVAASLVTGAAVSVSGVIGFVGLVIPHLVRLRLGGEHRPLLLFSVLLGGISLLWSDVLARSILSDGQELPVGVITALMGGPFFCLLLRRRTREVEI